MSIIQPPGPNRKTIAPIPTSYRGYRFRSRLEARWAVVFDHLGLSWEYEPQGYVINDRPYLPDFQINGPHTEPFWIEVKGSESGLDKEFLWDSGESLGRLLLLGPIPEPPVQGDWFWPVMRREWVDGAVCFNHASLLPNPVDGGLWYASHFRGADQSWLTPINMGNLKEPWVHKGALAAYRAGRSARFEHGESGAGR